MKVVRQEKPERYWVLPVVISGVILLGLTRFTSWERFVTTWRQIDYRWAGLAVVAYGIEILLMGVRALFLLADRTLPFCSVVLVSNVHNFVNKVLPARTGELAFPILMRRYVGVRPARGFSVLVLGRLMDVYVVAAIFSWVYLSQRERFNMRDTYWLLLGALWLGLVLIWIVLTRDGPWLKWMKLVRQIRLPAILGRIRDMACLAWDDVRVAVKIGLSGYGLLGGAACSIVIWGLLYCMFLALGYAMGITVTADQLLVGASLAILGTIVPVGGVGHIGGLEAGWTLGLYLVGVSPSLAASSGIMIGIITTCFAMAMAGVSLGILELDRRKVMKA